MTYEESAGGIVSNNGKIALVYQREYNNWSFPKGHLENGESELEAALREIREETGLIDLDLVLELGSYNRGTKVDSNIDKKITLFLFRTDETKLNPTKPDETIAKWIGIDSVCDHLYHEEDKEFYRNALPELRKL